VVGGSLPGAPFVAIGHNRRIAWGATNNRLDVTDTFQEQVRPDPASPSGLSIVHNGALEPIIPMPQRFFANQVGDGIPDNLGPVTGPPIPSVVLVVPRRNKGPIIALDAAAGTALSVQFVGFGGTRELDSFYGLNRARNGEEFEDALRRLDVGSQNFVYADLHGDIAYLMAGALPLREDLEAGVVSTACRRSSSATAPAATSGCPPRRRPIRRCRTSYCRSRSCRRSPTPTAG
jgi:penicillin amidase